MKKRRINRFCYCVAGVACVCISPFKTDLVKIDKVVHGSQSGKIGRRNKLMRIDNATAFKSDENMVLTSKYRIKHSFSTPYIQTPIRTVGRCIKT